MIVTKRKLQGVKKQDRSGMNQNRKKVIDRGGEKKKEEEGEYY